MTMHCMQKLAHTCSLKLCTYSVLDDQSQVTPVLCTIVVTKTLHVFQKKGMAEYITKKKSNKVLLTYPFRNSPCQSPLQEFPLPFLLT